jgi:hypothetical protein
MGDGGKVADADCGGVMLECRLQMQDLVYSLLLFVDIVAILPCFVTSMSLRRMPSLSALKNCITLNCVTTGLDTSGSYQRHTWIQLLLAAPSLPSRSLKDCFLALLLLAGKKGRGIQPRQNALIWSCLCFPHRPRSLFARDAPHILLPLLQCSSRVRGDSQHSRCLLLIETPAPFSELALIPVPFS